jgi:hypothetical protein
MAIREPILPPGEQVYPDLAGPALDLDPVEEAHREERRIHRHAVHAGGHVGHAVEIVLRGRTAAPLKGHRLRSAGIPAAPEVDTRHLRQHVPHRGAAEPLHRVSGEDEARESRPRPRRCERLEDRHPDLLLLEGLEVAGGVVDRIHVEGVGDEGVLQSLCGGGARG